MFNAVSSYSQFVGIKYSFSHEGKILTYDIIYCKTILTYIHEKVYSYFAIF